MNTGLTIQALEPGKDSKGLGKLRVSRPKKTDTAEQALAEKLYQINKLGKLLDYLVGPFLKKYANCANASIFILNEDSNKYGKLVLARTSFEKLKSKENRGAYDLKGPGLTAYVARTKQIYLTDNLREAIPTWKNIFTDANQLATFLGIPLLLGREKLLGVFRFTDFNNKNELKLLAPRLQQIANNIIAPRLKHLLDASQNDFNFLLRTLPDLIEFTVFDRTIPKTGLAEHLKCTMAKAIRENSEARSRKCYIITKLDENGHFTIDNIGGSLRLNAKLNKLIPLKGSFTERLINSNSSQYLHEFNNTGLAKAADLSLFTQGNVTNLPACALGCKISFGEKKYAALIILSNQFDLFPRHARLMEVACLLAGAIRARRDSSHFEITSLGLGHDVRPIVNRAQQMGDCLSIVQTLLNVFLDCHDDPQKTFQALLEVDASRLLEDALQTANIVTDSKCKFCQIKGTANKQRLMVRINPDPILGILFNLCKNAIVNSKGRPNSIHKVIFKKRGWLFYRIYNDGKSVPKAVRMALSSDPHDALFKPHYAIYSQKECHGLNISKSLCSTYKLTTGFNEQIPTIQNAELRYLPQHSKSIYKNCFELKIPLP